MTPDDVRAAAEQLVQFHERFAPLFGKEPGAGPRLRLPQGADDLPRAQEHRADRPAASATATGLGPAEVHRRRPLAIRRRPGRDPGRSSPTSWSPRRPARPIGIVGVIDESAFAKKGTALRRGGAAAQRPARQGGQLPGRRLPDRGDARPGTALLDHRLYPARVLVRRTRGERPAASRGPYPRGRDRSGPSRRSPPTGPRRRRARAASSLDWVTADEEYGQNGAPARRVGGLLEQRYVIEVPDDDHGLDRGPGRRASRPYSGRGQPPRRPRRDAVRSVAELAAGLPADAWTALQVREGAVGPLVFEFAAVRVWAVRHRKPGPPIWLLVRRSLEDDARGQVLRQQRRRRDAAGRAGAGGVHAAPGGGVLRGLPRATWGWRSTRRGRGSAGTIT